MPFFLVLAIVLSLGIGSSAALAQDSGERRPLFGIFNRSDSDSSARGPIHLDLPAKNTSGTRNTPYDFGTPNRSRDSEPSWVAEDKAFNQEFLRLYQQDLARSAQKTREWEQAESARVRAETAARLQEIEARKQQQANAGTTEIDLYAPATGTQPSTPPNAVYTAPQDRKPNGPIRLFER